MILDDVYGLLSDVLEFSIIKASLKLISSKFCVLKDVGSLKC